ncbi:MAG: hypothetical protein DME17_02560 [Candidatus Rokuibacteriota bacterium]|nr:MAG: hypothetical protein DME17_02560 [Candidatus Rokubacteria bacterium]
MSSPLGRGLGSPLLAGRRSPARGRRERAWSRGVARRRSAAESPDLLLDAPSRPRLGSRARVDGHRRGRAGDRVGRARPAARATHRGVHPPAGTPGRGLIASPPLVSVLIATWNNGAELQGCLGSLRQLEYPKDRLEVVIFDNGSTDGTEQAVRECSGKLEAEGWARVAFDRSSENLGAFGGRAAARRLLGPGADFVLSLDDDAEPEPDALVRLVRTAADPRVGVVGARIVYWDSPSETASAAGHFDARLGRFAERRPAGPAACDFVSSCGCLIRRRVMDELSGFDGSFFTSHGDVDLCLRAKARGWAVWYDPGAVIRHRVARGGTRTPERVYYGYRNKLLLLRRHVPPRRRPLVWGLYAVGWLPRILVGSVCHHRGLAWREIRAILLGVADGVRGRRGRATWF